MTSRIVIGLLAATAALGASAADVRPLLKAGFDFGGDTMVTVVFTDGETQNIKANEGLYLGGGMAIINDAKDWEYHLTLAYKFALIDAKNGDVEWTRLPLEALVFYRFPHVRLGGGLTYHLSPHLEGSGVVGGLDIKFKNALGVVLQADWRVTSTIAVGGRYTMLEYDAKGAFTGTVKANGIGVTFSMNF